MAHMIKFFGDHNAVLYERIGALEKRVKDLDVKYEQQSNKYAALQVAHNELQENVRAVTADISLFGPATKLVSIPKTAVYIKISMCGGGSVGTHTGGGGGASVYNLIVPLLDHSGHLLIKAGGGGHGDHPYGDASLVEIITKSDERRIYEAAGGNGPLGGVNNDNTVFNGDDGSAHSGGGSLFSLATRSHMSGWVGSGGGPAGDKPTDGGNGYVSVKFL